MNYLLDTNMFITAIRGEAFMKYIDQQYRKRDNILFTSCVVEGELKSFSIQRKWSYNKIQKMEKLLTDFTIYPIKTELIIDKYAEIDAYSQGKHPTIQLPTSARNMGKNDIWIAATASVLGATLLTMDKDFDHLNNVFLTVEWIDLKKLR